MLIGTLLIFFLLIWAHWMTSAQPEPRNRVERALQGDFFFKGDVRICRECGQKEKFTPEDGWFTVGEPVGTFACKVGHDTPEPLDPKRIYP